MKALGVPAGIQYIKAPPRMQLYLDYAADIYGIYLKYIAKVKYKIVQPTVPEKKWH